MRRFFLRVIFGSLAVRASAASGIGIILEILR